jgi:hypothetical protein
VCEREREREREREFVCVYLRKCVRGKELKEVRSLDIKKQLMVIVKFLNDNDKDR